jgi:16S rRNA (guanine527-N7)-methyltransferase
MKTALLSGLPQLGLRLSDAQADTFCRFGEALIEKNQVMNLTAITEPQEVARLHFLDCMALLNVADFRNKSVIDVGCGAGFPGVPLKIAEPSIELTLLDSLKKRVDWLSQVLPQLGQEAECVCARAEEYALQHRESYDLAVSRAVARLSMLSELCLPLVSVGGAFVAMKSVDSDEEISQAARGIGLLGGKVEKILDYPIPGTDAVHRAVVIRKVKKTPAQYPRRFAKIKQSPL